ncbi:MAG TPA: CAP domain-containing protein [Pyrinomonadaceae bacterium]|nr:CAP domain-containing protein [Pyrinomonadaceae bacterium]
MPSQIRIFPSLGTAAVFFAFASIISLGGTISAYAQKPKPTRKPAGTKPATATKPNVAVAAAGKCPGSTLTTDEVNQALAVHNFDRSAHNLAPLKWDCKLAAMAQEWATRGVFEHRDTPYGENLFVGGDTTASMNNMIDMWLSEKVFWTNKTGTCATGKVCGHYTQIVWKSTAKVGCGVNRNAPGNWKVMFVCNYDPSGNTGGPAF